MHDVLRSIAVCLHGCFCLELQSHTQEGPSRSRSYVCASFVNTKTPANVGEVVGPIVASSQLVAPTAVIINPGLHPMGAILKHSPEFFRGASTSAHISVALM